MRGDQLSGAGAIDRILRRIDATAADPAVGFPHYADVASGRWTRSPAGDWTGGFWNGMLWLAAAATGEPRYRDLATAWAERLRSRAASDTVFRGFLFWYGAAIGEVLGVSDAAADIAVAGARGLGGSFNAAARLLPLGSEAEEASDVGAGEANIDGVPGGTPLLAWAAARTGEAELRERALTHAERHVELCMRPDGSVVQSASFDRESGAVRRRYTHKGAHDDSTWLRAQSWAMLGFAQAAILDEPRFAPVCQRVCDWFVEHVPADGVAFWDFDDPSIPEAPRDTSGTAIAAAALLKAATFLDAPRARYRELAEHMVGALVARHLTPEGVLADGCYNRRIGLATSHELIWGSYFLLELLLVIDGRIDPRAV